MNVPRQTTLLVGDVPVPRLAFGIGSLMKWAPNHAHPLPTDSSKEVSQALSAGFRHFNTGDLYTNNESAARAIRDSGIPRGDLFFSLKVNTYASLGCGGAESMVESVRREMERFGMLGYVDLLQLHFPPRGYPGNMSNREAWRVLEQLKDQKMARLIGLSNWSLSDYADIIDAPDLKHKPQVNEFEFNPFLLSDPHFRERHLYEVEHGVVNMNYGVLTVLSGKLSRDQAPALLRELDSLAAETNLTPAELLISWALDRLNGIVVSSTSRQDRARRMADLFLSGQRPDLDPTVYERIEKAAGEDGFEGKIFYKHGHMDAAATKTHHTAINQEI